jgi:hypothetical protein
MIKTLLAAICTFAFLLFLPQTAHACFCSDLGVKSTFASSEAVFIGKVSEITAARKASVYYLMGSVSDILKSRGNGKWEKSLDKVQTVTLEVIEPLKGVTEKTFVLFTPTYNGGGNCGVPFKAGESFVVFARKTQPMLSKEETEQPKESSTLEMRLNAEADGFNKQLPPYETNICARTNRLDFMKEELVEIRRFVKNGIWKEAETSSPFMPLLKP